MPDDRPDPRVEARKGCWCETTRKPCPYHEGFIDGYDAATEDNDHA